ncbi:FecR domain-containing protein [Fulvivirgaceae bacterium BMA12]|uniref:FecR domain-containing protein n=1 Tax=Agaribacillus aureus TaxID=3051825 RepID=A0ABT8LG84_9BACT|nr:FecR domain-containing protein [Fulvivirgaceae bacterium BMA12]
MNWEILAKHLSNELSPTETAEVEEAINNNEADKNIFQEIMQWWPVQIMKRDVHLSQEEKQVTWQVIHAEINKTTPSGILQKKWVISMAASLGLLLIAYLIWPSNQRVATSKGQKSEISLADGSTVFLNHSSSLKYPRSFGEESREIKLKGEAFFDVQKNPALPFIIHTGNTSISVLGTSFNVFSRKDRQTIEVTVVTGKVLFSHEDRQEIIQPGEKGVYDRIKQRLYKIPQEDFNDLAWHSGNLAFKSTTFRQIKTILEKAFDITIEMDNADLNKCVVTSTIHFEDLEDVLEVLALTMGFEYEINKDLVKISGDGCD